MTSNWNTEGDFAEVVDTLEPVTLLSKGGQEEAIYDKVWKFHVQSTEIQGTEGAVVHLDAVWQLPIDDQLLTPIVGSRLLEEDSTCWVITKVEVLRGRTRIRCEARRVELAVGTAEWLDIERSIWGEVDIEGTLTPQILDWHIVRQALRGHIWSLAISQSGSEGEILQETFRLALTEPYHLTPHHRVRTQAGVIYQVVEGIEAARLGELWIYELRQETNAVT